MATPPERRTPKITIAGDLPDLHLELPLEKDKIEQIHQCIANGHLKITLSKVDLSQGRLGESYLYD